MISFQKNFLFVHIPRTGGNSIQSILLEYAQEERVALRIEQDGIERFGLHNPTYGVRKHSSLAEYRAALGEEQFRGLYKFTCVRNPWDRMISLYFQPTQQREVWDPRKFRNVVRRALPITEYLRLDEKKKNSFDNVDYIIRFENLANDFRVVCSTLGIAMPALPQHNQSSRQHYTAYYDRDLREFVRKRFACEIKRFGYTFD